MEKTNREIQQDKRAQYMAGTLTHQEYYIWLALFIGASKAQLPVSQERIDQSTDKYLNDIPLHLWDAQDFVIRRMARKKGLVWSLSDTVCLLKTIAKS